MNFNHLKGGEGLIAKEPDEFDGFMTIDGSRHAHKDEVVDTEQRDEHQCRFGPFSIAIRRHTDTELNRSLNFRFPSPLCRQLPPSRSITSSFPHQ